MSDWRYVMSRERVDGEDTYAIREFYTFGPGDVSWTKDAIAPRGETTGELALDLSRMLLAANSAEMLDLTLDEPAIVPTTKSCAYCRNGWNAGCGDESCCPPGWCQHCYPNGKP